MPPNNEVQTALDAMGDPQETSLSSTHRGFSRLTTRSGLSGGVGPLRPPRPPTSISVNLDIGIKYGLVMKGFKLLEATCSDLKHKLANSEEKVRSIEEKARSEEASYAEQVSALEEKARSKEASYAERVSGLEDQIRSYETAYMRLVSQADERLRTNVATHAVEVSRMAEGLRASEVAYSKLADELEECKNALKERESELTSLSDTIQRSVTCGICQNIPTQPCSTDCRHVFCAMCLISWWQTKQITSCPTCRTVSEFPPVRDSVQGLVALARTQAGDSGESDPFEAHIFDYFFSPKVSVLKRAQRVRWAVPIEILDD